MFLFLLEDQREKRAAGGYRKKVSTTGISVLATCIWYDFHTSFFPYTASTSLLSKCCLQGCSQIAKSDIP